MGAQAGVGGILAFLFPILRILLIAFLGYTALLFLLQRPLVFPGAGRNPPPPDRSPPPGTDQLWLAPSFGRVEAWLLPSANPDPGPALIFTHGNGELIDDWVGEMTDLPPAGVTLLLVEYPGYGISEGKPSRTTIRETMQVAYDTLAGHPAVDPDLIVPWGRSLGGGAAGDLALDRPVAALILQSTFSSTARMAWEAFYAPGFLVRDRWNNLRALEEFDGPVLLMHGRTDEVVPFSHALTLAGAREELEVTEIPCGHNDCHPAWPRIQALVLEFLEGL